MQMVGFRWLWLVVVSVSVAIAVGLSSSLHLLTLGLPAPPRSPEKMLMSTPGVSSNPAAIATVDGVRRDLAMPPTVLHPARYGTGLRRTLYLLASSTPTHQNTVRILFYGQSITKQEWWLDVVEQLRQRFPHANLIVENRAIGGFASSLLVRAAEHDLYSFYPDLMIFHNYGDEQNYETIIANTRRRTTAEIALMSDFISWLPGEPTTADATEALRVHRWHDQHVKWLDAIAAQYGCELIDIRTAWEQHLKNHALRSTEFLIDNDGHLNRQGNRLMAKLVIDHLLHSPIPSAADVPPTVVDYPSQQLQWRNGRLRQEFVGNRVDLVTRAHTSAPSFNAIGLNATVLIDDKPPSQWPELYHLTRPSDAFFVDVPALIQVRSKAPLQVENWSLVIREATPQMDRFEFELYGSKTGFDGRGVSTQPFVSQSGRIAIAPPDWWLDDGFQFNRQPVPAGFQIRWRVEPLFTDGYVPPLVSDPSRAVTTTLAQNLSNTRHVLELIVNQNQPLPFEALRIYRPPLAATPSAR